MENPVSKSPKDRVVPLPNGRFMAYKWGLLTTYQSWDDPPSNKVPQMENPVSKSPKDRVVPLPNGRFMAYKWG